ncbi:LysR substrate-binding domain-containing protein [Burkholderia perseverans]|uniref:LysR substrate-binding domain-containing protein n=1 Tax=Burkholderia perseverans TaxID=2615214 RepID=UPI001FEEEF5E|nr:LysR substrate-binding domain-containing protein [Burkholderia perseverans]
MASRINLDMDVLRTFVTGFELGSFARAAERLGRSQSAVSTQLRRLEEQVGQPLVQKSGRGLALTMAGESLLGYAKRLLALNDEAVESLRGTDVAGWVRLGLPQDFAEGWLPAVLQRFARAHPRVRVEVQVDRAVPLVERTLRGELDIALVWGESASMPRGEKVADVPLQWIGAPGWPGVASLGAEPLPFAAFAPPCGFRSAAVAALDAAGLPWRLVFTSPSLSGLWAAAEGGLGVTARTAIHLPKTLAALDPAATGLPRLPSIPLVLCRAETDPPAAVERLTAILLEMVRDEIGMAVERAA